MVALIVSACGAPPVGAGLRVLRDVPLPGTASRFDYQSIDAAAHRLYIAHLGDSTIVVFDTLSKKVIATIPDIAGVHGLLVIPELHRVYASATDDGAVVAIDSETFRVVARIPGGNYPDGLAFDPVHRDVYVSDERGGTGTVIDSGTNTVAATVELGGEAGNIQYDPRSHRMLVAVQSRNYVVAVDTATRRVSARVAISGCEHPHGLLIDEALQTALVACDENATLVELALPALTITGSAHVGETPDVLALDSTTQHLYVAAESGTLAVLNLTGGGLQVISRSFVGDNAHSVAIDPQDHSIYLPTVAAGQPVLREMTE